MSKEYAHLIKDDGWDTNEFRNILATMTELERIRYEIENCVNSIEPVQMVELLGKLADQLKEQTEML